MSVGNDRMVVMISLHSYTLYILMFCRVSLQESAESEESERSF